MISGGTLSSAARFMGIDLETSPGVLVPREETVLLAKAAINILKERGGAARVIDMCCGSGNLACAVAIAQEHATVWASDLTDETVSLAKRNVERLGLAPRVYVRQGDLFEGLAADQLHEKIDLVVCNPPYISTSRLSGEKSYLLATEPKEAFDGGPYGLSIHQRVIRDALIYLKPGGWIALEFGQSQEKQVHSLIVRTRHYGSIQLMSDTHGVPRVIIAQKMQ
ncbi:N5-glutamine methyltransferase family protein [Microvirga mediterraneensis]|uniref:peptide chain release factor N(5)-glutamine methyltransferase n=1 Tax=Microvirga mediterraneensis TaxID=2754695 RepID=A0A838BNA7_9HYPH|nr:HemK/PrmC family methyltransferase [Microvirga mediterraneensis]MBA1157017.1 peptide chain release factor N(5)-glutamine methyltransferase [Microvirga mediterraneensis]